jgi:hypothetical protein
MTMINPIIAALATEAATSELAIPLRVDMARATAAVQSISGYKVGDGRETLLEIEECVRRCQYNDADREAMAKLLGVVVSGDGSRDSKDFACRQLWIIGTPAEGSILADALKDPALSDMARYALENMEHQGVDAVLIQTLDHSDPRVQIGCINSLAARKSPGAVDAIKPLRKSKDKDVEAAAKHAIARLEGKIVP